MIRIFREGESEPGQLRHCDKGGLEMIMGNDVCHARS